MHLLEASDDNHQSVYKGGVTVQQVEDSLNYFREKVPDLLPVAVKLMTTGSVAAREAVRFNFSDTVNHIAKNIDDRYTDPDWEAHIESGSIVSELRNWWHLVEVAVECGLPQTKMFLDGAMITSGFANVSYLLGKERKGKSKRADDEYWRGIAAITLSGAIPAFSQTLPEYGQEFIDWAGQQSDLRGIVALVKERGVLHPKSIEGVIAQRGVEPPLQSGIL